MSPECQLPPCRRRAGATAGSRPRSDEPTSASVSSAPRSTSSPSRGYHRTSVEDIVRSAHTSRTAFYAFFDNREAAMYAALQASLRGLLDAVRNEPARRGDPTRASSRSASPRSSTTSCPTRPPRGSCCSKASAPRPRSTRCAPACASQVADHVREIWAELRPRSGLVAASRPRSRSACSACCSSRCCTWSRATASTRRRRTFPRSSPRSSGCSRPPPDRDRAARTLEPTVLKLGIVTPGADAAPARARDVGGDGHLRRRHRDRAGGRAARLPPLHLLGARRDPGRGRRDPRRRATGIRSRRSAR